MKKIQLNFQDMVVAVLAHARAHRAAWEGEEPVRQSMEELMSGAAALDAAARRQEEGSTDQTSVKNEVLMRLFEMVETAGKRATSYARRQQEPLLEAQVTVRAYQLDRIAEAEALRRCRSVIDTLTGLGDRLLPYKVTPALIAELEAAYAAANRTKAGQKDQQTDVTTQTARIATLEDSVRRILSTLDIEVESMVEDEDFVEGWFVARRVWDRKGRRAEEEGGVGNG